MKRMIKLNLAILFILNMFWAGSEKMPLLKVEAAKETIDNDFAIEEIILIVEIYYNEYLEEFSAHNLESEKIEPKKYLTKKLQAGGFVEEEIGNIFKVMAEKRQEELINLVVMYLNEEPLLARNVVILKLKDNSYSTKEIEDEFESMDIDWQEQAVKASEKYINSEVEVNAETYPIISRKHLRQFLMNEKEFTQVEAIHGIEEAIIDWNEQASIQAKYYLATEIYSKKDLLDKLITLEFTKGEAEYGINEMQINWKEQAVKIAESYLAQSPLKSKKTLLNYLQNAGFSEEEIDYTVKTLFKEDIQQDLEAEAEESSEEVQCVSISETPLIIKPIESITGQVEIFEQEATNKTAHQHEPSIKNMRSIISEKSQSANTEVLGVMKAEVEEDTEELADVSLFDNPIFTPVLMILMVGNLYLFQKS